MLLEASQPGPVALTWGQATRRHLGILLLSQLGEQVLLASDGWGPGMLLTVLPRPDHPTTETSVPRGRRASPQPAAQPWGPVCPVCCVISGRLSSLCLSVSACETSLSPTGPLG